MQILQTIVVKQVLTDLSRKHLSDRYEAQKLQLQKEMNHLLFEMKRLEKGKKLASQELKKRFELELQKRNEKIELLEFKTEQLHMLPLGSEIKEKELQALVTIRVGDRWEDVTEKTIIIKDGIVTDIRY